MAGTTTAGPDTSSALSRKRKLIAAAVLFVLVLGGALALILAMQKLRGEKTDHFGTFADEAAHYLTALLIRDYAAGGFHGSPVKFGLDYYLHRPKVAFGVWPPLFHFSLAGWMFLFPISAPSVLFYTSLLSAVLVAVFFAFLGREFSLTESLLMSAALALAPQFLELSSMVMADTLHALLCLLAMFTLALYLERRRPSLMLAAGLATALAFLTKNNAVLLVIAIPLTVLLCRAWWIFRRRETLGAVLVVLILGGAWELWAMRWILGVASSPTTIGDALLFYCQALYNVVGPLLLLLALFGAGWVIARALREHAPVRPLLAASFSLIVGTWLFHILLHRDEWERYMLPAIPAAIVLAGDCARRLSALASRSLRPMVPLGIWVALVGTQAYSAIHLPPSLNTAYPEVARFILDQTAANSDGVVLVSSDRNGESDCIAEIASREPKLRLWMLRASKVLSHSTWHGENYQLRYEHDEDVLKYLDSVPVDLVVIDPVSSWHQKHHAQLRSLIAAHPERFSLLLHTTPNENCRGPYCDVEVYRYRPSEGLAPAGIGVDAKEMIGRKLFKDWQVDRKGGFEQ